VKSDNEQDPPKLETTPLLVVFGDMDTGLIGGLALKPVLLRFGNRDTGLTGGLALNPICLGSKIVIPASSVGLL
jgi:hypothetical protein